MKILHSPHALAPNVWLRTFDSEGLGLKVVHRIESERGVWGI